MTTKDAFREAMQESLKNAEQWLQDARLLAKHSSLTHAIVLLDLAGEEIAKAFACWQVVMGALPTNHPLVRPKSKYTIEKVLDKLERESRRDKRRVNQGKMPKKQISVFSSHAMKYGLLDELSSHFFLFEKTRAEVAEAKAFFSSVHEKIGEIAVLKRSELMYVNLVESYEGLEVTSPMKTKPEAHDPIFRKIQNSLDIIKGLISTPVSVFKDWVSKRRSLLKERDSFFPKNPKWIQTE